jgi:hypothetical protein
MKPMLPPWMIEDLGRRSNERVDRRRPGVELPVQERHPEDRREEPRSGGTVIVIE